MELFQPTPDVIEAPLMETPKIHGPIKHQMIIKAEHDNSYVSKGRIFIFPDEISGTVCSGATLHCPCTNG